MLFFHRQNARQKPLQVKIPAASGGALEGRSLSCWGNLSPKPPNKDAIPPHRKQWGILASFRELKKKEVVLESVNTALLRTLNPEQVAVHIEQAGEAEMDEMWSFVGNKGNPRWLWHAIDHHTGKVLAYVFGRRKDTVFLKRKALLEPFGITRYYTDGWGAYERHLDAENHRVGKENTQKIESKHINLRTRIKRLVRRTICFFKTEQMHDLVIGLFINRYEFGVSV